jgi:ATP-dependent 26S proteasome regulatory subunit
LTRGHQLSDGFNGADLRNVVTEAGMFAIRDDRFVSPPFYVVAKLTSI